MLIAKASLKQCCCCAAAANKEASKANTKQQGLSASATCNFCKRCLWTPEENTCMSAAK